MRLLRYGLPAAVLLGSLALLPPVASANWTGTFTATINSVQSQDDNGNSSSYGVCSNSSEASGNLQPTFGSGYPYGSNNDSYTQWAWGAFSSAPLPPSGTTIVDARLWGAVAESTVNGYTAPATSVSLGAGAGRGSPFNNGWSTGQCEDAYGGDAAAISIPGNNSSVSFNIDAYNAAYAYATQGTGGWWNGGQYDLYLTGYWNGGDLWLAPRSTMSMQVQYAYTPAGPWVSQVRSGNGTQVAVSWGANGNGSDISYTLNRETVNSGGVVTQVNPSSGSSLSWSGGTVTADAALTCNEYGGCLPPSGYTTKYMVTVSSCSDNTGGQGQYGSTVAQSSWGASPRISVSGLAGGTCYNVSEQGAWFYGTSTWPSYYVLSAYAGWVSPWQHLYSGAGTSFQTSDQACGYGYVYSVAAMGPKAHTAYVNTSEWDEYPCSVSLSVPANVTNYINISWPEVTSATTYDVVWCQSSGCTQRSFTVSAGTMSAQLTGLTPNTEYTIWACSTTNAWGCPVAAAWTYAAVPTLSPNNNGAGLSYDQQPLTWNPNGNPPGTVYDLQQGTYAQSGAWQGGTVIYSGTGTDFTANQSAGGSYSYNVWAINAGYGTGTAASNGVPTQVASTPALTPTGSTTATVSWPTVAYMSQTGVVCEEPAGSAWVTIGTATGGATSVRVTGLQPNTQYYCATYAVASNQGLQWWQGTNTAYTAASAPAAVGISNITETSMTANWSPNGNPSGTKYFAVLQLYSGGSWLQTSGWTTATSWTFSGLTPGVQ